MARMGYCRHDTYVGGGAKCHQCESERMRKEEQRWQEEAAFKSKVIAIIEEYLKEKKEDA